MCLHFTTKILDEACEGEDADAIKDSKQKKKKKQKLNLSHKNTIAKDFSSNLCDVSKLPSTSFSNHTTIDTSNINNLLTNQLYLNRDGYALMLL